uniref:NADH:ubiquinone reductase (non-electrogenic) n=1 Tax=Tetraselmis sp. GSL018 TaxID=582737 RepID=A0A061RCA7_9CHLO
MISGPAFTAASSSKSNTSLCLAQDVGRPLRRCFCNQHLSAKVERKSLLKRTTRGNFKFSPVAAVIDKESLEASYKPSEQLAQSASTPTEVPKVVVLGSGWAAMSFIKQLSKTAASKYDITVVSPRNYFLYTPLLPAVATGTCEDRSIVEPVRNFVHGKAKYFEAECKQVDVAQKQITACYKKDSEAPGECFDIPYDILVVAVGSTRNTFGCPGVEEHCMFLKSIDDAHRLRSKISECFERAAVPCATEEEKQRLLSFVVVGGGPTGVEVAAELHDMVDEDMKRLYPELMRYVRIRLVENKDHVLGTYNRTISEYTAKQFERSGIELVVNNRVKAVEASSVQVSNSKTGEMQHIEYGACVWATGINTNPLIRQIQADLPEGSQGNGRFLVTDKYLRVRGSGGSIFCLGDAGSVTQEQAHAHAAELFREGDANGDGKLQLKELRDILLKGSKEFPQLADYAHFLDGKAGSLRLDLLAKKAISGIRGKQDTMSEALLGGLSMSSELSLEEFEGLLQKIDESLRGLPATAQVANQEGGYLAKIFGTAVVEPEADLSTLPGFEYKHKGSLAYVGEDNAVLDQPLLGTLLGKGAGIVWKGFETYGQLSTRNRVLVALDWFRAKVFGRDISNINSSRSG